MPTPVADGGSTFSRNITVLLNFSGPVLPSHTITALRNGVALATAPIRISSTQYQVVDTAPVGTSQYSATITDGVTTNTSSVVNITVKRANCAWAPNASQDGPYVPGTSGNLSGFEDFDWSNDSFWVGAVGVFDTTDVVEWQTTWEPGGDGVDRRPWLVEHPATMSTPRRLEIKAQQGSGFFGSGYGSGILRVRMLVNGDLVGDELQLVLADDQYGYEGATWVVYVAPPPPLPNPFTQITWDYSSSANGNIRNNDLPSNYGPLTPGVYAYFMKDGVEILANATMQAIAGPNSVLQPGDTIVVQGVLHNAEILPSDEDSQTENGPGNYIPYAKAVAQRNSLAYDGLLQPQDFGVAWEQYRNDCGYPIADDCVAFTVSAQPVIQSNGSCVFWFGPRIRLSQATMAGLASGTLLTSKINGVAVYRGAIQPSNLVYSRTNQDIFTMQTEVRGAVPARMGWGKFEFAGTTGAGANLEIVNGRIDPTGVSGFSYDPDTTQSAQVSSGPNVYGRLASPTMCAFGLVNNDGATYTIRVEYGPPGYDPNNGYAQFPASTLNATTCPVTWNGSEGVLTLPAMDKPCTGVLGEDNDVRIYLVRNGIDVGYLLMNVVDVPVSWPFQVPVWAAYVSL